MWRIALAAEAAGLMRGALDLTVDYVKARKQFKQPLAAFQAVQHRLAASRHTAAGCALLAMRAATTLSARAAATATL